MKETIFLLLLSALLVTSGCGRKSAVGFRMPEGNANKGKQAFVDLKCHYCHTVEAADLPAPVATKPAPVAIGGDVSRVRTYGELVTSIIHPSHRMTVEARQEWEITTKLSPMPDYNHVMTVEQMIDLVAFIQPRYRELAPLYTYVF